MLNITVGAWLDSVEGDDYYMLNIQKNNKRIFFGYENEVPDEVKKLVIDTVYVDFPSEAFGLEVL